MSGKRTAQERFPDVIAAPVRVLALRHALLLADLQAGECGEHFRLTPPSAGQTIGEAREFVAAGVPSC